MKFRKCSHEQTTLNRVLLKNRALDLHKHHKIIYSEKEEQIRTLKHQTHFNTTLTFFKIIISWQETMRSGKDREKSVLLSKLTYNRNEKVSEATWATCGTNVTFSLLVPWAQWQCVFIIYKNNFPSLTGSCSHCTCEGTNGRGGAKALPECTGHPAGHWRITA